MDGGIPWVSIVVAVIALISGALVAQSTNRKYNSEGADAISQAAVRLVKQYEESLKEANKENADLLSRNMLLEDEARRAESTRYENQLLKDRIRHLEIQIKAQNGEYDPPEPQPES